MWNSIFLLIIVIFVSCKDESKREKNNLNSREEQLLSEFKLTTFRKCLELGFEDSNQIKDLLKEDVSLANDFPLGLSNYKTIDSIARETSIRIKKDSIRIDKEYWSKMPEIEANEMRGKRVISICLELYQSVKLDSIAKDKMKI